MIKFWKLSVGISLILLSLSRISHAEELAITIDDLPFVGTNSQDEGNLRRSRERFLSILDALHNQGVPATGFVIAGAIGKNQWELLEAFRQQGNSIGNHSYSHPNLNRMSSEKYLEDLYKAEKILTPIMTEPKFFRFPYLAEGDGDKKREVQAFLRNNHYTIAPVTIDSKDYLFNERLLQIPWRVRKESVGKIKKQYLDFIWKQSIHAEKNTKTPNPKQILLIHANLLNSYCLNDIINMYREHGYQFITLEHALANNPPLEDPKPELEPESKPEFNLTQKENFPSPVKTLTQNKTHEAIDDTDQAAFDKLSQDWSLLREAMW